ncbi:hypothetical protein HK101_006852, partial [Irineochytrium annulatum]
MLSGSDLGACALPMSLIKSDHFVALNKPMFGGSGLCGMCVNITVAGTGKYVTAIVADECPECKTGALDLSPTLFKAFAPFSVGVLSLTWNEIACPSTTSTTVGFTWTSDSTQYWFNVQPYGTRYAVTALYVQPTSNTKTWTAVKRGSNNYWSISSMGKGPFNFKVVTRDGVTNVVNNIKLKAEVKPVAGTGNANAAPAKPAPTTTTVAPVKKPASTAAANKPASTHSSSDTTSVLDGIDLVGLGYQGLNAIPSSPPSNPRFLLDTPLPTSAFPLASTALASPANLYRITTGEAPGSCALPDEFPVDSFVVLNEPAAAAACGMCVSLTSATA